MRWLAVVGWLGAAAFVLSQFLSNPVPKYPNDLGPTTLCLAVAALIAVGGQIGRIGALAGTGAAAFATVVGLFFAVAGRGSWPVAIGAAVLMTISYAAARQMSQPPSDEMS